MSSPFTSCNWTCRSIEWLRFAILVPPEAHLLLHDIERTLQQIEAQNSFSLSRTLGIPNITSKGTLEQRIISVPAALFPHDHYRHISPGNTSTRRLIEEVPDNVPGADGSRDLHSPQSPKGFSELHNESPIECPSWTWRQEGQDIFIVVQVPRLVRPWLSHFYSSYAQHLPTSSRLMLPLHPQLSISNLAA